MIGKYRWWPDPWSVFCLLPSLSDKTSKMSRTIHNVTGSSMQCGTIVCSTLVDWRYFCSDTIWWLRPQTSIHTRSKSVAQAYQNSTSTDLAELVTHSATSGKSSKSPSICFRDETWTVTNQIWIYWSPSTMWSAKITILRFEVLWTWQQCKQGILFISLWHYYVPGAKLQDMWMMA